MPDHITRYSKMPIPPVEARTAHFTAGAITVGVEYRVLTAAEAAGLTDSNEIAAGGYVKPAEEFHDRGVSLHVWGETDGRRAEYLRFDCFDEEPHYHYISWDNRTNEMLHIDPVADGDPLAWALERVRTRLPQMLERAGAPALAAQVDPRAIEELMPRVAEAAYRARFQAQGNRAARD
jgi:hypothetical protein